MNVGGPLTTADDAALQVRWITPDIAKDAKLTRVPSIDGAQLIGRNGSGDYAGIAIPYFIPGEAHVREYRLRRDHPDLERQPDGSTKEKAKYLSPPGKGNMVYFPPGTTLELLANVAVPIIITEGEFKTLALSRLAFHALSDAAAAPRFVPIGLGGVWNWRGTIGKDTAPDGSRVDVKGPVPDLNRITWKKRRVTIIFDKDLEEKEQVRIARFELTRELQRRGSQVFWFAWPKDAPEDAKGVDDLLAASGPDLVLHLIANAARPSTKVITASERLASSSTKEFIAIGEDRFRLTVPSIGVVFEIDRLRRDRHELIGELSVRCELPGARVIDGTLTIADFNMSSARARTDRAKLLAERSNAADLDWIALTEEFCQRVLQADRVGQPAVDLRTLPLPDADDDIEVEGLYFPKRHPSAIFGDGGTAKSYTGLFLAGRMAERGIPVALFDWELAGEDHRDRLERLFGDDMPRIMYARCERPLVYEADRLRRIVRENKIEFTLFDSVAFACDGPPESAEVAGRYFRAVRQIGGGSLHIAHINKGENADKKPFGSAFWHNGARSTWFVKLAEATAGTDVLSVGFFNRKSNLGRLRNPAGFNITFTEDRTTFKRSDVAESPDLAGQLSVRQRMAFLLRKGAMAPEVIAGEIEADVDTVRRTASRYKKFFATLKDGKLALLERSAS